MCVCVCARAGAPWERRLCGPHAYIYIYIYRGGRGLRGEQQINIYIFISYRGDVGFAEGLFRRALAVEPTHALSLTRYAGPLYIYIYIYSAYNDIRILQHFMSYGPGRRRPRSGPHCVVHIMYHLFYLWYHILYIYGHITIPLEMFLLRVRAGPRAVCRLAAVMWRSCNKSCGGHVAVMQRTTVTWRARNGHVTVM